MLGVRLLNRNLVRGRHIAGEIGAEWAERIEAEKSTDDLLTLVHQIVPFHMAHNAEPEAVDLLLEVNISRGSSDSRPFTWRTIPSQRPSTCCWRC